MVWSAEGLASFSDGNIRKQSFEKHMVTSGQSDVLFNFLSYNLVKYLIILLEVIFTLLVRRYVWSNMQIIDEFRKQVLLSWSGIRVWKFLMRVNM